MEKLWKKMSLAVVLLFSLMIFAPYPALAGYAPASGTPTLTYGADGNYTVSSVDDLNKLRSDIDNGIDYSGQHVVLTQDIDVSSGNLSSFPSNNAFNGVFNGRFHTINGYTDAKSGLFGVVDKNGIVENVKVDGNVNISDKTGIITRTKGAYSYGLIANVSAGIITRCSTTGTIKNTGSGMSIAGIVGTSYYKDSETNTYLKGSIDNCYSNLTFDNESSSQGVGRAGISITPGMSIKHSYFYGKFMYQNQPDVGSSIYPIMKTSITPGLTVETCAYDNDVLGSPTLLPNGSPVVYTTQQMKDKDSFTALGFDFDKTWMIDPSVNNGYPYLNPDNESKVPAKIPVDIKITAEDKVYVPGAGSVKTTDDSLKAQIADVSVVPESDGDADLISQYDVSAAYDGDAYFNAPTIGDVPLNIDSKNIKISFTPNDDYDFVVGKVVSATGKLKDDGTAAPTEDEEKQQIEDAKMAENILYSKLKVGQGAVPSFQWTGDRSTVSGKEGSILLNDYDWDVFSSARSGYKVRDGYYNDWFTAVKDELKRMEKQGINVQDVKMTEWEKLVLAITAIGYDPRDITYDGADLIDIISNKNYLNASNQYFTPQYAVLALNSYNYIDSVPKDENHIDESYLDGLIHSWAASAKGTTAADGSTVVSNSAPDMAVMLVQPIAAYYDQNKNAQDGDTYYDVKVGMEHCFDQFSNSQTYRGSFWGGYTDMGSGIIDLNNPWTNAQIYMTLGMAKANIFDSKYIKDGKTMIDAALQGFDVEKGTTIYDNSTYEPAQICRGIDSLVRVYEGRNSIFDCTDVTDSTVPVNNAVEALPAVDNITSSDKAQVDAAKASYDALSAPKKASISQDKADKLTAAEEKVSGNEDTQTIKVTNLLPDVSYRLGDDAKASVKAENLSDSDKDVSLIAALYDNNDKFISYASGKQTIKAGGSSVLTSMLKIPAEGIYKLKAFVWDSLESMNPLSNVIDIPVSNDN